MARNPLQDDREGVVKETPIEPPDDYDDEVVRIAEQAGETHREEGCRWDTYFYKVVLGGNLAVVQRVAQYMHDNDMRESLDWLWQTGAYEEARYNIKKQQQTSKLYITQRLMLVGFLVLNFLLTPLFYILHIFSVSFLNRQQKRISGSIQLPLAYAVFSQNTEMISFLLSQGVDMEHIDKLGNNIFHYISDLSSVAADTAIEIFINTVKFIDDTETVRRLLIQHRNSAGLTAVEYAAKFGSPFLLTQILKQPNLLQHTPFAVSPDKVSFGDPGKPSVTDANTKVELVDVSTYEAGALADQSTLLNFLSDRDIPQMSKEDLLVFDNTELIGKWVGLKIRQMIAGVMCFQLVDIIITAILLFMLKECVTGANGKNFLMWKMERDGHTQLEEITAWAHNGSYVFEATAFDNILNYYRREKQLNWLKNLVKEAPDAATQLFTGAFGSIHPDIYDPQNDKWTVSRNTLDQQQLDNLYDQAMTMGEFSANYSQLYVYRELSDVLTQYAKQLVKNKSSIFEDYFFMFSDPYAAFHNNVVIQGNNGSIRLHTVLSTVDVFYRVCVDVTEFSREDVRGGEELLIREELYAIVSEAESGSDSCMYKLVLDVMEEEHCELTEAVDVANTIVHSASSTTTSAIDELSKLIIIVCICLYVLLDYFERCMSVWCSMSHQRTARDMMVAVLGRKVPGSYARKQLNIFSYCCIIYWFIIQEHLDKFMDAGRELDKYMAVINSGTVMFISAIVIRFLMHIHAMRLLPGIGHFVITTFMMGTDLIHFSVVFGMVLGIFSLLFNILIDNPSCPIEKSEGFTGLIDSLFSTFKLTFGHGEFDVYYINTPVKLTYVLYVIIVGLLLMNLIIAIMSTTATDIMADPWKDALWQVEWLDEATSVEYTFSIVGLLCRRCPVGFGHLSHKKAGFVVKKVNGDEWRVYVENFQCTPLK